MLGSIYHRTKKSFKITLTRFYHLLRNVIMGVLRNVTKSVKHYSCIDVYSYICLQHLSNERKSMFKSGDSRAF